MMCPDSLSHKFLNLRGTPCPINLIRCRLALEDLGPNECLRVELDTGEPELMVIPGLRDSGYKVDIIERKLTSIICMVNAYSQ